VAAPHDVTVHRHACYGRPARFALTCFFRTLRTSPCTFRHPRCDGTRHLFDNRQAGVASRNERITFRVEVISRTLDEVIGALARALDRAILGRAVESVIRQPRDFSLGR
jgi:hypothetical protein